MRTMKLATILVVCSLAFLGATLAAQPAEAKIPTPCLIGPWYSGCLIPSCDPNSYCCGPECMPP